MAIARGGLVTYSSEHVAYGQRLTQYLDTLQRDLNELRQMVSVLDDALTVPGRHPGADGDGAGRQATHGPSRPTERLALDQARECLQRELNNGASYIRYAIAYVRGVTASMDRSLSQWEGEDSALDSGGTP
ncbi:DUF7169 domain-containing protein [Streptomyces scopuliridis]|uniref:DUF7169 domain-containing protein n=1 Tax=Streptomyces scopuliridis TaxID=452529 RepID=UPI003F55E7C8